MALPGATSKGAGICDDAKMYVSFSTFPFPRPTPTPGPHGVRGISAIPVRLKAPATETRSAPVRVTGSIRQISGASPRVARRSPEGRTVRDSNQERGAEGGGGRVKIGRRGVGEAVAVRARESRRMGWGYILIGVGGPIGGWQLDNSDKGW